MRSLLLEMLIGGKVCFTFTHCVRFQELISTNGGSVGVSDNLINSVKHLLFDVENW